jgi:putative membrane protein
MPAVIRAVLLFGCALMVAYLMITKEISYFLNPRFQYLSIFSLIVLLALGCVQIQHYKRGNVHRIGIWGYGMMCLPIAAFLLFPSKPMDASIADNKVYTYVNDTKPKQPKKEEIGYVDDSWEKPYQDKANQLVKQKTIELTTQNYSQVMDVLMLYPERFTGKKIKTKGFVYREKGFSAEEFVLGRLAMTCCVADSSVVGFLIESPWGDQMKKEQWYEVEGTFEMKKSEQGDVPSIKLESYKRVPAEKDSYIYQTF